MCVVPGVGEWGGGLQMTGAWEIGDFQNNGNLGQAANLDTVFVGRGVPYIHVLVTEDIL